MLRRAGASRVDLLTFYKAYIRSAVEYASAVWHTGLTGEQADRIESVQRRALRIIEPGLSYHEALSLTGLHGDAARPPGEDGPSLLRGDPQPRPQAPLPAAGPEDGELWPEAPASLPCNVSAHTEGP